MKKILTHAFRILVGIVFLASFQSCKYLNTLQDVQQNFNAAAAAENQLRFSEPLQAGDFTLPNSESHVQYALALKGVEDLIEGSRDRLIDDKLLGVAYAIQSMSLWRLGRDDEAIKVANAAEKDMKDPKIVFYPRDRALLLALEGLIEGERAFEYSQQDSVPYDSLKSSAENALSVISDAMDAVSAEHPVNTYLLTSKLTIYSTWLDAAFGKPDEREILGKTRKTLQKLENTIKNPDSELIKYWKKKIGG